jgi:hypothetical protein
MQHKKRMILIPLAAVVAILITAMTRRAGKPGPGMAQCK